MVRPTELPGGAGPCFAGLTISLCGWRVPLSIYRRHSEKLERELLDAALQLGRHMVDDPFGNRVELLERGDTLLGPQKEHP